MSFSQEPRYTEWVIRNSSELNCPDFMHKKRRTAGTEFSVWAMIGVDYNSELVFYCWTEEEDHNQKEDTEDGWAYDSGTLH